MGEKSRADEESRTLRANNVVLQNEKQKLTDDLKKLLEENTHLLNGIESEQK